MTPSLGMRALALAMLLLVGPRVADAQPLGVLHIKVALVDADGKPVAIPRVVLLLSENPSTAEPRRIPTALDGTITLKLRPGNYTVESDRPIVFLGTAYQWTEYVDVRAGQDTVLDLTRANAEVVAMSAVPANTPSADAPVGADSAMLLTKWQDSVVQVWTPTAHASGFLIDATGLVATNYKVIGAATSVEVQLTSAVKVAGTVIATDRVRDVAILWIDPQVMAQARPLVPGCAESKEPPVGSQQDVFTIGAPLFALKDITGGTVTRVESQMFLADFRRLENSGGPVFASDGTLVGITAAADDDDRGLRGDRRVIKINQACEAIATAKKKMAGATPPRAMHLPVEPLDSTQGKASGEAMLAKAGAPPRGSNLGQVKISSADFEIAFITQKFIRDGRNQTGAFTDFGNWSAYVALAPPVLLVRVTPKFEESFWTTVARGAAQTQGMALPPMKHFKSNFLRMQAFCSDTDVTPIHPFTIEQHVPDKPALIEGFYAFDPAAFGTQCATVKFVLYSEKEPQKGDTRVVDSALLQQIAQDFAR